MERSGCRRPRQTFIKSSLACEAHLKLRVDKRSTEPVDRAPGLPYISLADVDNDGLLDLVFAADPDNSGVVLSMDRYESKVYWNIGAQGARSLYWLRLRLSGVKDAELVGAKVELLAAGKRQYRWIHPDHFYKSGCALEAHFGLGQQAAADLKITLPGGKTVSLAGVKADQFLDLNLTNSQSTPVRAETKP